MFANLGFFFVLLCLILSVYGSGMALYAARKRHRRAYRSARAAATASGLLCILASILLWIMFYQRDYSVFYIFKNSSNDLPAFYTLAAFWSSLEGSHFFWTLLFAIVTIIAHWTYAEDNEHIMPYVSFSLQMVLTFMYLLAITYSDPFKQMLPVPPDGQGMNALLQNPYMAIHPPTLFLGYVSLSVPFAYAIAALCYGDVTQGWLKTVRRWCLFAFVVLTCGIFLGGRWAYVELGWAGYWAWDPVENSSFLPWLFCTAALHSLIVQDKMGQLKRLTMILVFLAFFFSFFGTFITRSGVISSVHSFAQSPIGPAYLIFLAVLLCFSLALYAWRAPSLLPADTNKVWGFSKESALVLTQFLLLTFAAIICIGTLMPIVSEWITGQKISVQAPYFNFFAPYIGLGFIIAITIGNLMRYQSNKFAGGARPFLIGFVVSLPLTLAFIYYGDVLRTWGKPFHFAVQVVGIFLCFWAMATLTWDLLARYKDMQWKTSAFLKRNLSFTGAYVAHIGLITAILGFLGNYRSLDKLVTLKAGEKVEFYGYEFQFNGVQVKQDKNATIFAAPLQYFQNNHPIGVIEAGQSRYPTKAELLTEVGLRSHFWHDIYVVLADFNRETLNSATLHIHINPTVRIVWLSCFLMAIGGLIAIFDKYRGQKSRDVIAGEWEIGHLAGTVLVIAALGFGFAGKAQAAYFNVPEDINKEEFRNVADSLRCPTCTGLSVLNSEEKFATQIKEVLVEEMRKGKSKQEIIAYFVQNYGPWIMREPPKEGFHILAWIIPIGFLVIGPPLIWFLVWRRRRGYNTLGVRPEEEIVREMLTKVEARL